MKLHYRWRTSEFSLDKIHYRVKNLGAAKRVVARALRSISEESLTPAEFNVLAAQHTAQYGPRCLNERFGLLCSTGNRLAEELASVIAQVKIVGHRRPGAHARYSA